MNARQQINKQILEALLAANEAWPDQRFGQLLVNCDVTHDISQQAEGFQAPVNMVSYHEEPSVVLARVLAAIERMSK